MGFDVALVDWNMPNLNGLEFVREIRSDPELGKLVLIMMPSDARVDLAAALEAGANGYLMKPFTRGQLVEQLTLLGVLGD